MAKYRFTIAIKLEEEGKDEAPMMDSSLVYNGLNQGAVLALESMIPAIIEKLNDMGQRAARGDAGPAIGLGKK